MFVFSSVKKSDGEYRTPFIQDSYTNYQNVFLKHFGLLLFLHQRYQYFPVFPPAVFTASSSPSSCPRLSAVLCAVSPLGKVFCRGRVISRPPCPADSASCIWTRSPETAQIAGRCYPQQHWTSGDGLRVLPSPPLPSFSSLSLIFMTLRRLEARREKVCIGSLVNLLNETVT